MSQYDVSKNQIRQNAINIKQDGMLLASFKVNGRKSLIVDIDTEFATEIDLNRLFAKVIQLLETEL